MNTTHNHNGEEQYGDVIKSLKSLKKVGAPPAFEADLMRRINRAEYQAANPVGFWAKLFANPLFASGAAMATVASVLLIMVFTGKVSQPLSPELKQFLQQGVTASADTIVILPGGGGNTAALSIHTPAATPKNVLGETDGTAPVMRALIEDKTETKEENVKGGSLQIGAGNTATEEEKQPALNKMMGKIKADKDTVPVQKKKEK